MLVLGAMVVVMVLVQMPRMVQGWREAPDARQRIAAHLVSWGCRPPGLLLPVDNAEVQRRIDALRSPDGEERVRAASWLADHGVRDSAPEIVAAMWSPGTGRPCQLAHSLGGLGYAEAVDDLLDAANQTSNTDLRVCALMGLSHLASDTAVEGLLALCDDPFTARLAVEGLGEIADERALPRLHRIISESDIRSLRRAAILAVERIDLVTADDPTPGLARRVLDAAARGQIDAWAIRWLARVRDDRAVASLEIAIGEPRLGRSDCEVLAAALLAFGAEGREALSRVAAAHPTENVRKSASNALSLFGSFATAPVP